MIKKIYLDNSTAARPSVRTVKSMMPFLDGDLWGSPTAPHQSGNMLIPHISEAYRSIYQIVGAKEIDDFVFTSSGAEAVNQAIFSAFINVTHTTGKNQFITAITDEAPSILSLERLAAMDCVCKQVRPNKDGKITAEILSKAISPRTAMISLSWTNGLTGTIHPVAEIAELCKQRGILLHLDVTHALGKLYFEMDEIEAQFISFNGAQIHAPIGSGGLFIKSGTRCLPYIVGGSEQGGLRAGGFSLAQLAALGQAAKEALESRDLICMEAARLRDKLEIEVAAHYPEAVPLFRNQERLPHCTAIAFPGIVNESLLYALNRKGLYASIGGGNFQSLSLLLQHTGVSEGLAQAAISFSLSRETTEEEIDCAVDIIADCAKHLRKTWRA